MATESAVKRDDAKIPTHLWDYRVLFLLGQTQLQLKHVRAFALLRRAMWTRWRRNVLTSWRVWWERHNEAVKSFVGQDVGTLLYARGIAACRHARRSTFWAWDQGSAIFFWRWPEVYFWDVALGVAQNWTSKPEPRIAAQRNLGDAATIIMMETKIVDIRQKGYIAPDAEVLTNTLDENFWCIDNDYGEMFLNFSLHPELSKFSGMDLISWTAFLVFAATIFPSTAI